VNIAITRCCFGDTYAISSFVVRGLDFWCFERDSIPRGTYRVVLDWSNRFGKELPHILDVPGYEEVRIYSGTALEDVEGGLLIGKNLNKNGDRVMNSCAAMIEFMDVMQSAYDRNEEVWAEIK
jgi:hypothetical protein